VYERQFTYNPATQGTQLIIQTWGFGGTSNAPGGTNASGFVIGPGGFDPVIALFSGAIGAGGGQIAFNDDQGNSPTNTPCGPGTGATFGGSCFDSRLVFNNLSAGTYTLAMSLFGNPPGANENSPYAGGLTDFGSGETTGARTGRYAVDVTAVPEPVTSLLIGSGLLALGFGLRRRRSN
jgi:hypothetical protein